MGIVKYLNRGNINYKSQITNLKQITMTKIQNVLDIEYLNLEFICYLVLGIWDFYLLSG